MITTIPNTTSDLAKQKSTTEEDNLVNSIRGMSCFKHKRQQTRQSCNSGWNTVLQEHEENALKKTINFVSTDTIKSAYAIQSMDQMKTFEPSTS